MSLDYIFCHGSGSPEGTGALDEPESSGDSDGDGGVSDEEGASAGTVMSDEGKQGQGDDQDAALADLDPDVKRSERPADGLVRQANFGEGPSKAESVKEAESEGEAGAQSEVGFAMQEVFEPDADDGEGDDGLDDARREAGDAEHGKR